MRIASRIAALVLALGLAASVASAQYFGRNKVQWETFDFKVLETEHFRIFFYPDERDAAEQAARMAERWYGRIAPILKHEMRGKQVIILYADHPDFEQTNVVSGEINEATGGVTESLKRRIILPLSASLAETDHVIGHELVHAFQYDITGEGGGGSSMVPGVTRLPLWFVEGMAEYMSLGPVDPHTMMWMRDAVARNEMPDLGELASGAFFPYRYGQAFWAYLTGLYGDEILGRALRAGARAGDVRAALQHVTSRNADSLVAGWHRAVRESAELVAPVTDSMVPIARRVVGGEGQETRLNIAPSLSPDGRRVAFFSEAGLFSIDLFLADVETGKTIRRLFSTQRDPHYESLQFINSAGAWDPQGRRFAFGGVARGKPVLTIIDAESGNVRHEARFDDLGEIFNPTWSPDGRAVAFSAQVGGHTDLFVYDIESRELERLTNDAYADLQPAWSPDGTIIAFVTDRFGTSTAQLSYGPYRLAVIEPGSRAIRPLVSLGNAKHINPQWSPDGRILYFLSDRGGITNVYRLAEDQVTQVTNLFTGISGITGTSPAMSVAAQSGRMVFTLYRNGGYELHAVDEPETLAGPLHALPPATAMLPPVDRTSSLVLAGLENPRAALPPDTGWVAASYSPGLSLDFIAQPSLAVAADRYGTYVGGGVTLYWSDMLGDHNLVTMGQVSTFEDLNFAALLAYENRKSRWNWGGVLQQVPYTYGGLAAGQGTVGGTPAYIEQTEIFRQNIRQLAGYVAYPFNRSQRIEFQAGAQHITFDHHITTRAYSLATGRQILEEREDFPAGDPLTLGTASAALVHDNSFFGATSPVLGRRYRLEVSPVFGSIDYTTGIADFRQYVMPVRPFTVAARILHVGRYGAGSDDERIQPLYIGYPSLVRGYDFNSFSSAECPGDLSLGCPVVDRLIGSRMLVGNVELRFPLFGVLGLGQGFYGFLPVEMAIFYDGGVAWNRTEDPQIFGGARHMVTSAGITLRLNFFGYAIGALDWVKPFQRPERGWMFRFSFTPGF
jgi:hypothetical protein